VSVYCKTLFLFYHYYFSEIAGTKQLERKKKKGRVIQGERYKEKKNAICRKSKEKNEKERRKKRVY
jgi:hypothetical protein